MSRWGTCVGIGVAVGAMVLLASCGPTEVRGQDGREGVVGLRGPKRFDRFACFNMTGAVAGFDITLHFAAGHDPATLTLPTLNVRPGAVGGCVPPGVPEGVVKVTCTLHGQTRTCELTAGSGQRLLSAAFWLGPPQMGAGEPSRLSGEGLQTAAGGGLIHLSEGQTVD